MDFSFVFKSIFFSFFVFILLFAICFISTQKIIIDNNNYSVKNTVKESLDLGVYRTTGEIKIDNEMLIKKMILNYIRDNNLKVDDITLEIALDEITNIVTVHIITSKELFNTDSLTDYTFSYKLEKVTG